MSTKHANDLSKQLRGSEKSEETGDPSRRLKKKQDRDLAERSGDLSVCGDERSPLYRVAPSGNRSSKNHRPADALTHSYKQNPSGTVTAPHQISAEPMRGSPFLTTSGVETGASTQSCGSKRTRPSAEAPPPKTSREGSNKGSRRDRKGSSPNPPGSDKILDPSVPFLIPHYRLFHVVWRLAPRVEAWGFYLFAGGEEKYVSALTGRVRSFQYHEARGVGPDHYAPEFILNFIAHIPPGSRDRYLAIVRSQALIDDVEADDPAEWCFDVLGELKAEEIIPQNIDVFTVFDTPHRPVGPQYQGP